MFLTLDVYDPKKNIIESNDGLVSAFLDILPGKNSEDISIVAKDMYGHIIKDGYLLKIRNNVIYKYTNVNILLGFELDNEGCIKIE